MVTYSPKTKFRMKLILLTILVILISSCNKHIAKSDQKAERKQTVREYLGERLVENNKRENIYGVDTGLTQEEYENFRKNYREAIDKHSFSKNYHFEDTAFKMFIKARINLNNLDKLIELGWRPGNVDKSRTDEILTRGRIILMGSTSDSMKFTYKNGHKHGKIWQFKIDKILNGSEVMDEGDQEGSIINVIDFSYVNESSEDGYLPNTKYILFFEYPRYDLSMPYYTSFKGKHVIDGDFVYDANWYKITNGDPESRKKRRISLESYLKLIKDVLEANDSKNFFNRTYH